MQLPLAHCVSAVQGQFVGRLVACPQALAVCAAVGAARLAIIGSAISEVIPIRLIASRLGIPSNFASSGAFASTSFAFLSSERATVELRSPQSLARLPTLRGL